MLTFSLSAAQTSSSLLAITTLSLLVPAAFAGTAVASAKDTEIGVLNLSHGTAIVLLIVYGLSLFFQVCEEAYTPIKQHPSSSFVSQLIHVFVFLAQDPSPSGKHYTIAISFYPILTLYLSLCPVV